MYTVLLMPFYITALLGVLKFSGLFTARPENYRELACSGLASLRAAFRAYLPAA